MEQCRSLGLKYGGSTLRLLLLAGKNFGGWLHLAGTILDHTGGLGDTHRSDCGDGKMY